MEGVQGKVAEAFAPGVDEAGKAGDDAGRKWSGSMKAAMGVAAIATGAVAAFKGLYEVGAVFDDVTDTIRVGTGAQGEALDGLVGVAKSVGQNVPAEFGAIGTTVADLNTRLGLSGDTLENVASQYLEAGRILGEDVDIASTSAAFSAFKIEGDNVAGAMDSLFQVSQATGVGMNELAAGVQTAAPALQNLGFGFEDSIALMGSLDKAGLNSQAVMASMSKGLVTLAKDGEDPASAFERVTGELQGFVDAGDTAGALDLASQVFGTRGASQFVGALQSGVLNMEDLMGATGATGDTILGVGEDTADLAEQWQIFKNRALTAIEPVATMVFGALGNAMGFVNDLLEGFDFSVFADVLPMISPLGMAFQVLQPVLPVIVDALSQVGEILGPVLSVALTSLLPLLTSIGEVFAQLLAQVLPMLMPFLAEMANLFRALLIPILGLIEPMSGLVTALLPVLLVALQAIIPIIGGVVDAIGTIMIPIVNTLVDVLGGVITFLTGVFTGDWEKAWEGVQQIFTGLWEGMEDIGRGVINGMIDLINGFIGGINEVGNFVADITGGAIDVTVDKLPHLADGATVRPRPGGTLAVLAEAGRPETVVDTGLMNQALEEGLEGRTGGGGPLVQVDVHAGPDQDETVIGQVAGARAAHELSLI